MLNNKYYFFRGFFLWLVEKMKRKRFSETEKNGSKKFDVGIISIVPSVF
jgi:hypothetical protein